MSISAAWFALASDWYESPLFMGLTAQHRLAWIGVLTHAKRRGRGGVVSARPDLVARDMGLRDERVVKDLVKAAHTHGAMTTDPENGDWCLKNWHLYQDPAAKARYKSGEPTEHFSKRRLTSTASKHADQDMYISGSLGAEGGSAGGGDSLSSGTACLPACPDGDDAAACLRSQHIDEPTFSQLIGAGVTAEQIRQARNDVVADAKQKHLNNPKGVLVSTLRRRLGIRKGAQPIGGLVTGANRAARIAEIKNQLASAKSGKVSQ